MIARWERKDTGEAHVLEDDGRLVRYFTTTWQHRRRHVKTVSRFSQRALATNSRERLIEIVQATLGASHERKEA